MTYGSSIFTSWFQLIWEVNEVNLSLSYGGVVHNHDTLGGNVCAKVVGNSKTKYVTEDNRAHESRLKYANESINMEINAIQQPK